MRRFYTSFLLLAFFFDLSKASAEDLNLNRRQFFLGPEIYHVKRLKKGGTEQQGTSVGLRGGYDRLKRYGWYIGGDAFYSSGKLNGHSGSGSDLRSHFYCSSIEGRVGYTLQQKECLQIAFTPFVGGGYYVEKNNFKDPSPLPIHFRTHFSYATAGFLSRLHIGDRFEAGINFKVKIPIEPRCRVSHDPENDPVTQNIKSREHYRVDVPISYKIDCEGRFACCLSPFYEYQNYGSHPNFPFDYIKTQFMSWGATLELQYRL